MTLVGGTSLRQQALSELHNSLSEANYGVRSQAMSVTVPLLRSRSFLQGPVVGPLLTDRNPSINLAGLKLLMETEVIREEVVENVFHLLDNGPASLRSYTATTMGLCRGTRRKEAIARLKAHLPSEHTPEVGVQLRRTLWKLGDRSDPAGFRDDYLKYLSQRQIGPLNFVALEGLAEMVDEITIPVDRIHAAIKDCKNFMEGRRWKEIPETLISYYRNLGSFGNSLCQKYPLERMRLIDSRRHMKIPTPSYYEPHVIRTHLKGRWSWLIGTGLGKLWHQPGLEESGLNAEWISPLLPLVMRSAPRFNPFGKSVLFQTISLLGYAFCRAADVIETLLPLFKEDGDTLAEAFQKKMGDENKIIICASQTIARLAPHLDEDGVRRLFQFIKDPSRPMAARKAALEVFIFMKERAGSYLAELIHFASNDTSPLYRVTTDVLCQLSPFTNDEQRNQIVPLLKLGQFESRFAAYVAVTCPFVESRGQEHSPPIEAIAASLRIILDIDQNSAASNEEYRSLCYVLGVLHFCGPDVLQQADPDEMRQTLDRVERRFLAFGPFSQFLADGGRTDFLLRECRSILKDHGSETFPLLLFNALGVYAEPLLPDLKRIFLQADPHSLVKLTASAAILAVTSPREILFDSRTP